MSNEQLSLGILKPNSDSFRNKRTMPERIAYDFVFPDSGGMYVYYKDQHGKEFKYPEKCFPFPEVITAINPVKRAAINSFKAFLALGTPTKALLVFKFLVLRGFRSKMLSLADNYCECCLNQFYLEPNRYSTVAREIYQFKTNNKYPNLIEAVCIILEFDNAYRYRFQDVAGEFSKIHLRFKGIRWELNRVLEHFLFREQNTNVKSNVEKLLKLLNLLLWIPSIKRRLTSFLNKLNITNLALDYNDLYWCLFRKDYNFINLSYEYRQECLKQIDNGVDIVEIFN